MLIDAEWPVLSQHGGRNMGGAAALVVGSCARIVNARSGLVRLGGKLCRESSSDGIEIRQPDAY
jgi:hypothetical protein